MDGTNKQDLNEIDQVYAWFNIKENYNLAATTWNEFYNGVTVPLKGD